MQAQVELPTHNFPKALVRMFNKNNSNARDKVVYNESKCISDVFCFFVCLFVENGSY